MKARSGRERASRELQPRFQEAIDAAAMRAGLIGTDEYLVEWSSEARSCGDDLGAEVEAECAHLDAAYPDERLERLVRASGKEEDG